MRTVFEGLNFPFSHPGYDALDVGSSYRFQTAGGLGLGVHLFVYNALNSDLSEPMVIKLDPQPATGYFLPRPGRSFEARFELTY